jgi:Protein of unknown function (DUF4058)
MTLLDHFRSPLSDRRHWQSFHSAWATYLVETLNQVLPQDYFAESNVKFEPVMVEQVEVGIFSSERSTKLIGAIEIVSPANKDRPSQREVFVTKCQSYLEQGVGLIVIDVVTARKRSLHTQLMAQIGSQAQSTEGNLYAAAYRSVVLESPQVEVWFESLELGRSLPTLPLWLKDGGCFPVDLAQTYDRTCKAQRL